MANDAKAYLSSTRWSILIRTAARRSHHHPDQNMVYVTTTRTIFKPDKIATAALYGLSVNESELLCGCAL